MVRRKKPTGRRRVVRGEWRPLTVLCPICEAGTVTAGGCGRCGASLVEVASRRAAAEPLEVTSPGAECCRRVPSVAIRQHWRHTHTSYDLSRRNLWRSLAGLIDHDEAAQAAALEVLRDRAEVLRS